MGNNNESCESFLEQGKKGGEILPFSTLISSCDINIGKDNNRIENANIDGTTYKIKNSNGFKFSKLIIRNPLLIE